MNLWHDIPSGDRATAVVNMMIIISELPPHTTLEMQTIFEDYKYLKHSQITVEEYLGCEPACEKVDEAIGLYRKFFENKRTIRHHSKTN